MNNYDENELRQKKKDKKEKEREERKRQKKEKQEKMRKENEKIEKEKMKMKKLEIEKREKELIEREREEIERIEKEEKEKKKRQKMLERIEKEEKERQEQRQRLRQYREFEIRRREYFQRYMEINRIEQPQRITNLEEEKIKNKYNDIKQYLSEPIKIDEMQLKKINDSFNYYCIICFANFKLNDEILYLPCMHPYHKNCIIKWFLKEDNCPLCRDDYRKNKSNLNNYFINNISVMQGENINLNNENRIASLPDNNIG